MKEQIEQRVKELQRKIDTDAEYTRPEHRTAGEQTLALYYIALELDALRADLLAINADRGDPRGL